MSKKVKVLISVLVATLLLTVGATATVMAEGEEETTPPAEASAKGLLERVADILEIDKEDLIDAFKQAQQEMMGDAFIDRLNQAVKEGLITQEQADEILEWWSERPDEALREWRGRKPEAIEPGMFQHNIRSRLSSKFRARLCPESPEEAD